MITRNRTQNLTKFQKNTNEQAPYLSYMTSYDFSVPQVQVTSSWTDISVDQEIKENATSEFKVIHSSPYQNCKEAR